MTIWKPKASRHATTSHLAFLDIRFKYTKHIVFRDIARHTNGERVGSLYIELGTVELSALKHALMLAGEMISRTI